MPSEDFDRGSPRDTWRRLRALVADAREAYEAEADVYDVPECRHCGREMETGAVGGGEITYGCYRDDCSYKDDNIGSYVIKRNTHAASRERARYRAVLDVVQALAREEHDRPHDPEACIGCSTPLDGRIEEITGTCDDCQEVLGR